MIGKCSRLPRFTSLRPEIATHNKLRSHKRGLSGPSKAESMLAALFPDSKPRKHPKGRQAPKKRLVPQHLGSSEKPSKKNQSFFNEVEEFLEKERASSTRLPLKENRTKENAKISAVPPGMYVSQKSIFDVFKIPEPALQKSEDAFEADAFEAYEALVQDFFREPMERKSTTVVLDKEMRASVRSWLLEDEPRIKMQAPTLRLLFKEGTENLLHRYSRESLQKRIEKELRDQQKTFRKDTFWNDNQYQYASNLIHELTIFCQCNHKALPIVVIFEKMKETGQLKKKTIDVCLQTAMSFSGSILSRNRSSMLSTLPRNSSLLDMLDSKDASSANSLDIKHELHTLNVPEQLAMANDLLYRPTEHSSSILTRRLISIGDAANALDSIEARMTGEAKLRAYSQVFSLFLDLGDIRSALFLMKKMEEGHNEVALQREQFVQLFAATAEKGYFCHGADPIEEISELGYAEGSGPALFDQLAFEMSLYVDSITSASAKRLQKSFQRGFHCGGGVEGEMDLSALAPLEPLREAVAPTSLLADRVVIDTSSRCCAASGTRLRLIDLEKHQKRRMKQGLLDLGQGNIRHIRALQSFWRWLIHRTGPQFTAIIDGANVAYYMQNFDKGKFSFSQIDFVVTAMEKNDLNPLVILPRKYTQDRFILTLGTTTKTQTVSATDRLILERLVETGRIYSVPQGCLDDYFWISATVADQSRHEADTKSTQSSNRKRLGSGKHPVVITNDQIRDHKEYELFESKVFNRWYSNSIVNYNFTGFVDDECVDPEIAFTPADTFSREIQRNTCSHGQIAWHFPVSDWEPSDWFCIRIPSPSKL